MSAKNTNLEVEVKFFVPSLAALRERLVTAGGQLVRPRVYERNVRFDTVDERLRRRWALLRLRQDTAVTLTFKGIPRHSQPSEARVREELEIQVNDFDTAMVILQRLGFIPLQIYEKYRETYHLENVEVVLDELPFGDFAELEGEEADIKAVAASLGLDWNQRILANYLALMDRLKAHHNLSFDDLTFANFADLSISIADVLPAMFQNEPTA